MKTKKNPPAARSPATAAMTNKTKRTMLSRSMVSVTRLLLQPRPAVRDIPLPHLERNLHGGRGDPVLIYVADNSVDSALSPQKAFQLGVAFRITIMGMFNMS